MPKPNFFIVGAPKCGTTAMYDYLDQHPNVYMCPLKEPYFFGSDFSGAVSDKFRMSMEEYIALFKGATNQKRIGEASPSYLSSKQAAKEIHAFQPNAKIIIMLRSPVDMLHSMYHHRRFTGDEPRHSFDEAMEAELDEQTLKPNFIPYFSLTNYTESVERYVATFGREQVHVILFDDMRTQLAQVYRDTLYFLDIDPDFEANFEIINASKQVRSHAVEGIMRRLGLTPKQARTSPLYNLATRFLPTRVYQPIIQTALKLYTRPAEKTLMSPTIRQRLQAHFQAEVKALSDLLGRDLSHWVANDSPVVRKEGG